MPVYAEASGILNDTPEAILALVAPGIPAAVIASVNVSEVGIAN